MSNITVYERNVDNNNKYTYKPKDYCKLECDYLGNIYFNYKNNYYLVSLDNYFKFGIELIKIKNINYFKNMLKENEHVKSNYKSSKIYSSLDTLSGKAYEKITDMNEEEREEYLMKNDYMTHDSSFTEKKYYWLKDDNSSEDNDIFTLNGIINLEDSKLEGSTGIILSKLLSPTSGTFDVILMNGKLNSKHVVSSIERSDGSYSSRLTVYTSGDLRTNFIDVSKYSKLCIDKDDILVVS